MSVYGGARELLLGNLVCFNTRKHTNERVYYSLESLKDEPTADDAIVYSGSIPAYTEQVFRMYGGPEEECSLQNAAILGLYRRTRQSQHTIF